MKILIIDDERAVCEVLAAVLASNFAGEGIEVLARGTAQTGLDRARDGDIDLVLLDLNLPDRPGTEVLRELKGSGATWDLPVVMISGEESPEQLRECLELGADDYLHKPFPPIRLVARVRSIRRTKQLESFAQQLVASSLDIIVASNQSHRIIEFNPAAETAFGYRRAEALGQPVEMLYAESALHQRVHGAVEERGQFLGEVLNRRKSGEVFVSLIAAAKLRNRAGESMGSVGISRDVTHEREAEEVRYRHLVALSEITNDPRLNSGSLEVAFQSVTEWAARSLQVARSSIWLFDAARQKLQCLNLFEAELRRHSAGQEWSRLDSPAYFAALERKETIAADDAQADPRIAELMANHFERLNITAVLHAPIFLGSELIGVICNESAGTPRTWSVSDQFFVGSLANLAALAVQNYERLQAELGQRRSHERKAAILESALDGIITMDHEGRIQEFNPAAERMFGYRRKQVLGEPLADKIIPPALRSSHTRGLAHCLRTGEGAVLGQRIETTAMRADGSTFPVELSITRIAQSEPPIFTGFLRDITERREAERQLLDREEELKRNFELAPAGITMLDLEGRIVDANPAFSGITEQPLEQLRGRLLEELLVPEDAPLWSSTLPGVLASTTPATLELRCLIRANEIAHLSLHASVICDREGRPQRLMVMHTNITARKRMETELTQSRKLKALGEISGGVAHEFNNLLSPVLIQTSLIQRQYAHDPKLHDLLRPIREAVEQSADLCRRALAIGRRASDTTGALSLSKEVENVFRLLACTMDRRIETKIDLGEDENRVLAAPSHISQIVMNLMLNARDALLERLEVETAHGTDWQPQLAVRTWQARAERPGVVKSRAVLCRGLTIRDNALGMPPHVLSRVFEPFFSTKAAKGTGLGLATVWSVVDELGGWITVDSQVGVGTTFNIHLPCERTASRPAGVTAAEPPPPPKQVIQRVLLVEDNELVGRAVAALLRNAHHQVTLAVDGVQGWEILRRDLQAFDVVLTDANMPRLSGLELLSRIRATEFRGRVILTTGYLTTEQIEELQRHGVTEFLQKPIVAERLLEYIGGTFDSRKAAGAAAG